MNNGTSKQVQQAQRYVVRSDGFGPMNSSATVGEWWQVVDTKAQRGRRVVSLHCSEAEAKTRAWELNVLAEANEQGGAR